MVCYSFHWHNPSGRNMTLGRTHPPTEMSTRNISWGVKAASALGWQPYQLRVPTIVKFWSLKLLERSGPVQACNGISFTFGAQIFMVPQPGTLGKIDQAYLESRPGSSVSIATGYGLGRCGYRIPVEARFSALVHTGPGAQRAPCTMGTGSFPG